VPLLRRLVRYELRLWQSLYVWTFRRPVARAGAETFGYSSPVTPVLAAFIGLSALEIPVAHLLLPWEQIRRVFLAFGAYGLFWMIGLLASLRVRPHVVDDTGLRVRYAITVDSTIPWDAVADVRARRRSFASGRSGKPHVEPGAAGSALHLPVMGTTTVDVTLRRPTAVRLPKDQAEAIAELHFYADDPGSLVASARARIVTPIRTPSEARTR
jgi:hypothetical protein